MKVVACIPVYGRRRVLSRTITRLYKKNKIFKVICVGDDIRDKTIAEQFGAEWVEAPNSPLGHKWNEAFKAAEKHNPDACLYIGSDDWLQDDWFDVTTPYLEEYDMVGTPDFTMCDIGEHDRRVAYCGGYPETSERYMELVGGGRMLSRRLLEGMNWMPFEESWDMSMDYAMTQHAKRLGAKVLCLPHHTLVVLALSGNKWVTKHNYDQLVDVYKCSEYDSDTATMFLEDKFPEVFSLYDDSKWITT
jgi:glycosyltransferase involved in cell wall biosynthesis